MYVPVFVKPASASVVVVFFGLVVVLSAFVVSYPAVVFDEPPAVRLLLPVA